MSIKAQFGAKVRKLREKKPWSQEQLADASSLHRTYISGIERGVRNPTLTVIARLAKALDVQPAELLAKEKRK